MSGLNPGGSWDNAILEDPPAPTSGRQLVADQGAEAVRAAMPEAHQDAFDRAHPYTPINTAQERLGRLADQMQTYEEAGQDVPNRLVTDIQRAAQQSRQLLNDYNRNLGSFIDRNAVQYVDGSQVSLLTHVSNQFGYSTPAQNTGTASVAHSRGHGHGGGGRRHGGGGGGGSKHGVLEPTSGNKRKKGR